MKLLETSYLVDYERGRASARDFFAANEHVPLVASTVSMFELAFGVVWDSKRELSELQESLRWVDFLEFSTLDAIEGARIQAELQSAGDRIPIGDVMIAGVARNRGATLVAGDDHFESIDGLSIENHRHA
ncbi:PIN domain-containing protein [Halodesulfurarchaeum sp. HSR-GB]|uniref:PIN domain-containing protein n=1 Tax=Halodesulfurarchaeum sp. HSR-GB TaxID=3074077 RepID=UPI00285E35F8|nr:PIN domain-containing protein [Halodesulfurarchaeum sp. HSR-GB]MDR5657359.1 PIN domain-containing protein [Halodesulfurarchaeum sp. HSR-GB]